MPRIRSIKPKFWDDKKLSEVSRDARLLYIGLWSHSDDLGVVISDPVFIKSKIFPYDKLNEYVLEGWIQELTEKGFIYAIDFSRESFFWIKNFKKHQKIDRPNYAEVYIDHQSLTKLIHATINDELTPIDEQSTNDRRTIDEQSTNNRRTIDDQSLRDRIGRDRKGGDWRGREENRNKSFKLWNIYDKKFEEIGKLFLGLTEEGFCTWKKFVDFVVEKEFTDLFETKFIDPPNFQKMAIKENFTKEKWDTVLRKILSTGVKPEHNLYFRIPEFMKNEKNKRDNGSNGVGKLHPSDKP